MNLKRIRAVEAIGGFRLKLTLTDGSVVERDVEHLLAGPAFADLRSDPAAFAAVRVEDGTVAWPSGADLCPDMVIWNGPPPDDAQATPLPRTGT